MALSKRELRKQADPGLKFSPGNGLLHAEAIEFVLRAAVKNISGRRVLMLYIYNRKAVETGDYSPLYTGFQVKEDYAALERKADGTLKWRSASLYNLFQSNYIYAKKYAFYTQKDEQLVTRFCGIPEKTGLEALDALQSKIMAERLKKRVVARERKIVERMKPLRTLPREMNGWIRLEVLPAYIYYKYRKSKKPMAGYCTSCRNDVSVTGVRHGKSGVCPHCGRAVTYKSEGRGGNVWDCATAQVLENSQGGELVLRIIKAHVSYRDYREPKIDVWENARVFIQWDDAGVLTADSYYYSYVKGYLTNWKNGVRPQFSNWQVNFENDLCGHLYHKTLDAVLRGTPWRYSQLKQFYLKDRQPLEVVPYLSAYLRYPMTEYLVKLGLFKLASHVVYDYHSSDINAKGKNLREVLGVDPEDLPVLQRLNADTYQLGLCKALKEQHIRCDETLLLWYAQQEIRSKEDVLYPLRFMTPLKLTRYAEEQFERLKDKKTQYGARRYEKLSRVLNEYKDYLCLGYGLDYDLTNSFVLFPRDLMLAHDQASSLFDAQKKELCNKLIEQAYPGLLQRYGFTKYGFTMLPPQSAEEIVREGHTLHHCVGSYAERVAKGECIIFFLRRTENVSEPFITVELCDGAVTQARGQNNGDPPPEVKKYLALWERKILQMQSGSKAA
jgi:predicted RNA-binding Zn-ribbon protein involved in translation (DUF1610 family)